MSLPLGGADAFVDGVKSPTSVKGGADAFVDGVKSPTTVTSRLMDILRLSATGSMSMSALGDLVFSEPFLKIPGEPDLPRHFGLSEPFPKITGEPDLPRPGRLLSIIVGGICGVFGSICTILIHTRL